MKILRSYILGEFFAPFVMSMFVLTFVLLLGNLMKFVELIINKGVSVFLVLKLFLTLVPYLLSYTLPIALLSAVLLSFGRLSSDNEIIAIRTGGINLFSLILPFWVFGIILSLFSVILNDRLIPESHYAFRKVILDVGIKNPAAAIEAGTFITSFQKYVLFIYRIDQNKLSGIRIYEPQEGKPTRTIVAKHGEFISMPEKRMVKLKLMDGTSDEPDPNNPNNFYKLNFKTYFMNMDLSQGLENKTIDKKAKDMTIKELKQEMAKFDPSGIDITPLTTELHKKIAMAFSCLIFILLGPPLAIITRQRGRAINFGLAFLIVGMYYLMLMGAEALSLQAKLAPALSMWLPNIILGLIGLILTLKLCAY